MELKKPIKGFYGKVFLYSDKETSNSGSGTCNNSGIGTCSNGGSGTCNNSGSGTCDNTKPSTPNKK